MSSVKYKVYDLQTAQSEFDIILDILGDNEALLDSLVTDLDEFSSLAVTKLQEQIEEFRDMHNQMTEDMGLAKTEIIDTEKNATEKFKPLDYNKVLELKTPEVLSALKSIGNVLADNLNSSSLAPTPDFISWVNKTDNELNDGIIEALNNPIDERRQRKAEEVYHANQAVYESAYESFLDDMTFQTEIEYIERVISEMDGFSKNDFPLIAEGTLYETMFEGAVGVTYNDFTETVTDKYNTDTNGILPNSITGWLVLGAGVVAVVSGWAEITAAAMVLYEGAMVLYEGAMILASTIGAFVSAGYQWLIGSATSLVVQLKAGGSKVINGVWKKWLGGDINKIRYNWETFEKELIAIGENGGLAAGETVSLSRSSVEMILGMFLISDTAIHTPGTVAELSDDLENGNRMEFLSDLLIEVFSPIPFTQIDDNILDRIDDNIW